MEEKDNLENKNIDFLSVEVGDEVLEKHTQRLGFVHRKSKLFKSGHGFIVKWYNGVDKDTAYLSKKTQQSLIKTGNNRFEDSDSD
jgi:hypothetical protein